MESVAKRIRYLAACHQADNREAAIFDVFHKDIRSRYFPGGTEVLLTGLQDAVAIPLETGLEALKAATMYKREKSLVYGSFIVTGTSPAGRKLAAPLVYFPATLDHFDVSGQAMTALRIRTDDLCLNFPVLAELAGTSERENETADIESILQKFPEPPILESRLAELLALVRDFFPNVSVDALYGYPELSSERDVKARSRDKRLACVPASFMALVPNPQSTRGVLFELAEIAAREPTPPLRSLFDLATAAGPEEVDDFRTVPAVLSNAQKKIVRSARRNTLSLVVGPPGTGKSYTVSALALDHVLRGQSVLVACRTERAIDVIEKKLEALLGETTPILRGGTGDHRKRLKAFLERLLDSGLEWETTETPSKLTRRLSTSVRRLERAGKALDARHELELAWGRLTSQTSPLSWLERLRLRYLDWRLGDAPALFELVEGLEREIEERIALATALLRSTRLTTIQKLLRQHRKELKRFQGAIRARTSSRQEKLFSEMNLALLTTAFPLWMCTFKELSRLAPLEPELFDVVIVDEATQSDMASALPALFRARRAVVTGDPRQLRHVSFLSRARQQALAEEHALDDDDAQALDYRERSLLDRVDEALASADQVAFLDEHFRSLPSIIAFSNREFYAGRLRVMTARPDTERKRGVELRQVGGRRGENGVNREEADALVAELEAWVEREKGLPRSVCHSIGVLAALRDQAEHLSRRISKELSLEAIEKHDILVSTAYGFQGEERDIMLLSLVVDAETHPSAFRYLNQPDVFNVAITRARARQIVFASVGSSQAPSGSLLARYLQDLAREEDDAHERHESTADDAFLEDVMSRLRDAGCRLYPTYVVAGMVVDLVVEKARPLGIDLIGHPGELAPALDRERYLMLRRAGLPVFPLPLYAWRKDPSASIQAILSRID